MDIELNGVLKKRIEFAKKLIGAYPLKMLKAMLYVKILEIKI